MEMQMFQMEIRCRFNRENFVFASREKKFFFCSHFYLKIEN